MINPFTGGFLYTINSSTLSYCFLIFNSRGVRVALRARGLKKRGQEENFNDAKRKKYFKHLKKKKNETFYGPAIISG